MDMQNLLHNYPTNLLFAALVGALLMWILISWIHRRLQRAQREEADAEVSRVRRVFLGELDSKDDDIAQLENRLAEAEQLSQGLGQQSTLLAQEQQRFADLKTRYLNDVGRARNLLKTRGDASAELERRIQEAQARYEELHARWDEERKRYAKLITEKNQHIADLESRLEGQVLEDSPLADPSLQSYSQGQLEAMLVDLRHQVAERDTNLQSLQQQLAQSGSSTPEAAEFHQLQEQLRAADNKLSAKDREISRLRNQLLKETATPAVTAMPLAQLGDNNTELLSVQNALNTAEAELAHAKLEVEHLRPAAARLRRLESQMQLLLKDNAPDNAELKSLELELEQLQSQLLQQQANARLNIEKQASAFQRQLNAKTDTIGRLNRQLQASRKD